MGARRAPGSGFSIAVRKIIPDSLARYQTGAPANNNATSSAASGLEK
jgi:hypothetical protein